MASDGGEGGIRTHVPGLTDHPISSRRRYDRFGTSPELNLLFYKRRCRVADHPICSAIQGLALRARCARSHSLPTNASSRRRYGPALRLTPSGVRRTRDAWSRNSAPHPLRYLSVTLKPRHAIHPWSRAQPRHPWLVARRLGLPFKAVLEIPPRPLRYLSRNSIRYFTGDVAASQSSAVRNLPICQVYRFGSRAARSAPLCLSARMDTGIGERILNEAG